MRPRFSPAHWQVTCPKRRQYGFTLIEIMVVLVLIGISITIISLNLGRDVNQLAEQEARRFAALVDQLREESILTGRRYGIEVDETQGRYQFLVFDGRWTPVDKDELFRPRVVPEYLTILLETEEKQKENSLLIIDALGEIQPFVFTIIGRDFDYDVNLDNSQNIGVQRKQREES